MKRILQQLIHGENLSTTQAEQLLFMLVDGDHEPALAGAVLATMQAKGETPEEVRGFANAMRTRAMDPGISSDLPAVDVVGTGGDGSGSLNLSTGAALLAAACGVPVVKHGNRSITSRCGSADVLEEMGVQVPTPDHAAKLLDQTGFTFLFAPHFHPAMKAIAPVRQALGVRTIFNILGPLTNPASPPFSVIGAFSPSVAKLMAEALSGLPIQRAFVVHGAHGWDEATPVGPFQLWDVYPGTYQHVVRDPAAAGLARCSANDLAGGNASQNASAIRQVFRGEPGAHRDALTLGAGLALEVCGAAATIDEGVQIAREALDAGRAEVLVGRLAAFSQPAGKTRV